MSVNIYRVEFFSTCPINNQRVKYELTIEDPTAANPLLVEDLIDAVSLLDRNIHEEIADQLHREFGGKQTLKAFHHGVEIETRRD